MHLSGEWGGSLIDVYQFHDDPVTDPGDDPADDPADDPGTGWLALLQQILARLKDLIQRLLAIFV